jgi:glucose-1-phosphate cytidylyltransferase
MKVVILAGGFGTRLSEYTKNIPKPMVTIGNKPIIMHIIEIYKKYGFNDFIIAVGYKGFIIKRFFKNKKIKVKCINTGLNTMTGGRLKKIKKYLLPDEDFMLTYGDGLSSVNLKKLLKFHKKKNNLVTVTAVKPPARFGALKIKNDKVTEFREKFDSDTSWINGGFFVINYHFLDLIKGKNTYLEKEPLQKVAKLRRFGAYKHRGFWQCMDTKRDLDKLNQLVNLKKIYWLI